MRLLSLTPVVPPQSGSGPTWLVWVGVVLIVAGIAVRVVTWRSHRRDTRRRRSGIVRRPPRSRRDP